MEKEPAVRWVKVYTTNEESEAAIIRGLLESEGIQCRVETPRRVALVPVNFGRMGEIEILVHPTDFDKAGKVLEAARDEEVEEP